MPEVEQKPTIDFEALATKSPAETLFADLVSDRDSGYTKA
jgi:hypothetical protein